MLLLCSALFYTRNTRPHARTCGCCCNARFSALRHRLRYRCGICDRFHRLNGNLLLSPLLYALRSFLCPSCQKDAPELSFVGGRTCDLLGSKGDLHTRRGLLFLVGSSHRNRAFAYRTPRNDLYIYSLLADILCRQALYDTHRLSKTLTSLIFIILMGSLF